MDFPTLQEESFRVIFQAMCNFFYIQAFNAINASILWLVCIGLITLVFFPLNFPFFFLGWVHHEILRCWTLESCLRTWFFCVLVTAGAWFLSLVGMMCRLPLGVLLIDFRLVQRVPGDMHQACIFLTNRRITQMAYIVSLALASSDLLRVGWQGVCSSILFLTELAQLASACWVFLQGAPPS